MARGVKAKRRKSNGRKTRPTCIQFVVFRVLTPCSLEGEWKFTEKSAEFKYQYPTLQI